MKKKIIKIFVIFVILFSFTVPKFAYDEDPDEWDYVWLDEAIEEAKKSKEVNVLSKCAIAYDRASRTILWGKNENTQVPMASTTKIMTAIVMMEQIGEERLNETVEVNDVAANTIGSRLGLHTGDLITYNDLLYGLMLCSGNDAAVQIAISVSGSIENFAEEMNKKTEEMGLQNTHFITPHGLDRDGHYTTALELAQITDYALNIPKIAEVVSTRQYNVKINDYIKTISNTNELLGYLNGVNGVKTGYTSKAGRCLVTSVNRCGFNIIIVILGADTKKIRTQDSIKLIEYIYDQYEQVNIEEMVNAEYENWCQVNNKRIKIYKGIKTIPDIYRENGKYNIYPIKKKANINIESEAYLEFEAPVEENTIVGKIIVKSGDEIVDKIEIKTKEKVNRKGIIHYLLEILQLFQLAT